MNVRRFDVICCFGAAVLATILLTPCCGLEDEGPVSRISPSNPVLEVGTNLTLNCTLGQMHAESFTSQDLFFKLGNITLDSKFVTLLDNYTAVLNYPTDDKINKHVYCYARGNSQNDLIGQQSVIVGRKPMVPNITGCKVYNWERMVCHWRPTAKEQTNYTGMVTKVELHWTILKTYYYYCPNYEFSSCVWKKYDDSNSLQFGNSYFIKLKASNKIGKSISQTNRFKTSDLGMDNFKVSNPCVSVMT